MMKMIRNKKKRMRRCKETDLVEGLIRGETDLDFSVEAAIDGDVENGGDRLDLGVVLVGLVKEVRIGGLDHNRSLDSWRNLDDTDN